VVRGKAAPRAYWVEVLMFDGDLVREVTVTI
jgi:hypothetical protein